MWHPVVPKDRKQAFKTISFVFFSLLFLISIAIFQFLVLSSGPAKSNQSVGIDTTKQDVQGIQTYNPKAFTLSAIPKLKCTDDAEISRTCTGYYKADATYMKANCKTYTEAITDTSCGAPANYQPAFTARDAFERAKSEGFCKDNVGKVTRNLCNGCKTRFIETITDKFCHKNAVIIFDETCRDICI